MGHVLVMIIFTAIGYLYGYSTAKGEALTRKSKKAKLELSHLLEKQKKRGRHV